MSKGKIRAARFLANAALFIARLAYNTLRWMGCYEWQPDASAMGTQKSKGLSGSEGGKLLTENRQLTVKTPDNDFYPQVWDDWVAVDLGS